MAALIGIQVDGVDEAVALIGAWTRGEPTFYEEFEPPHGNSGYATAAELAVELAQFLEDNDDGVVYSGPKLNAVTVEGALHAMWQSQRVAGAAHGVSHRLGQWRAPGPRQQEALVWNVWSVVSSVSSVSSVFLYQFSSWLTLVHLKLGVHTSRIVNVSRGRRGIGPGPRTPWLFVWLNQVKSRAAPSPFPASFESRRC